SGLRPRYPLTRSVLWAMLIPAGLAAFAAYLALRGLGPLAFLHAQERFSQHELVGPVVGLSKGLQSAWHELTHGAMGTNHQSIVGATALGVAVVALVGIFRRLPPAYGAYVVLGLMVPLSSPTIGDPLK